MSGIGLVGGGLAQLSARGLHALFGAALLPIVARHLGAEAMGRYVLVLSIVTFIVTAGDAGLPLLAQREFPTAASAALVRAVRTARRRTAVILVAMAVAMAAALAPAELRMPLLVGLFGVPAVLSSNLAAAELTAALVPGVIARIEVPVRVVTFVATLLVVLAGGEVTAVVAVGVGGSYLAAVLAAIAVRRHTADRSAPTGPMLNTRSVLRRAAPLALLPMFGMVYSRSDVLILAAFRSSTEVGIYGAAYRLVDVAVSLLSVGSGLLVSVAVVVSVDQRWRVWRSGLWVVSGVALVAGAMGAVSSDVVLQLIGGSSYQQPIETWFGPVAAGWGVMLLMLALALMGIGLVNGALMVAWGLQRALLHHFVMVVGLNVLVTLLLTPGGGMIGTAASTLLVEIVAVANSTRIIRRSLAPAEAVIQVPATWRLAVVVIAIALAGSGMAAAGSGTTTRGFVVGVTAVIAAAVTRWATSVKHEVSRLEVWALAEREAPTLGGPNPEVR